MIGGYTAERIARETSEKVVLFDLTPVADRDMPPAAKAVRGDVTDPFQLADVIRRESVTRVVHLAGVLANALNAMPHRSIDINVGGLVNVLEAARVFALDRVVLASTAMAYDFRDPHASPITEDTPLFPTTLYAATKLAGEYLGLNYHRQFGVDFVAVRIVRAYGPGYRYPGAAPNDGARLIKDMIEGAISNNKVRVEHPPITVSEWVYAKDLAQGMTRACFVANPANRVFNLGGGRLRHCDEVIAIIRDLFPEVTFDVVEPAVKRPPQTNWTQPVDLTRSKKQLGYVPEFTLETGLADYVFETRRALNEAQPV
jgi:nucleoside-diphosphate-sugar epimerase